MIVFLDTETTGLNPKEDAVLEIGMVITDDALVEIARAAWVFTSGAFEYADLDPVVQTMHRDSGLWCDTLLAKGRVMDYIDDMIAWLKVNGGEGAPLAGNTIGFDRAFLAERAPALLACFHYRSIHDSSFNEVAKRLWWNAFDTRPRSAKAAHRALADIDDSIATLKHYIAAARLYGVPLGPVFAESHRAGDMVEIKIGDPL